MKTTSLYRNLFLIAFIFSSAGVLVNAQTGPKAAAAAPISLSLEELAARIPEVEAQIDERQVRAHELTSDIIRLDERIEGRIDRILKQLEGMKDSKESGTRVVRMKKEAMEGLASTIDFYDSKRRELKLEAYARDPKIEREQLFESVSKYDERIEKRVSQILELGQTFTAHKDLAKYNHSRYGGGWGRWGGGTTRRKNPAYQQNKTQTMHTEQTRTELLDALQKSISHIDSRNREIEEIMKKEITDQYRALLQEELDQNESLIVMREEQVGMMLNNPEGGGSAVSTKSAMTTSSVIDDLIADIQSDFDDMFAGINELNQERAALTYLKERLDTAKAELVASQKESGE
tara:strand:+ start:1320 stop:2360 length:1041 start_codon:yes stop_codon:yes gene_type:complete